MPKSKKQKQQRVEHNRLLNDALGKRYDDANKKDMFYLESPVKTYSPGEVASPFRDRVELKGPPEMEEIDINGVKVMAVLNDLPPSENWQLAMSDPFLKVSRPIPRTFVTEMMTSVISELKKCTTEPLYQPYSGHEFYIPGDEKELELCIREYERRKMFAYCALKSDSLMNRTHKLECEWEKKSELVGGFKGHCFLCNECPCVWDQKELVDKLFGEGIKKLVSKHNLANGRTTEALQRAESYYKELRFKCYRDLAKAIHGNIVERAPLPECVEIRVKYWFSGADDSPKFTGFLEEKKQVI